MPDRPVHVDDLEVERCEFPVARVSKIDEDASKISVVDDEVGDFRDHSTHGSPGVDISHPDEPVIPSELLKATSEALRDEAAEPENPEGRGAGEEDQGSMPAREE